jgi:CysZ protein
MIGAFSKAFAQLADGGVLRVLFLSIAAAIVIYSLLIAGVFWTLGQFDITALPWLDTAADWGAGLAAVVIATLLFPGILSAVVGLFLESVAAAVERRHYSDLPKAQPAHWRDSALAALRLGGLTAVLNLLLLPLYLLFIFIPPLSFALYYAVNGKLLGREYFEIVALRRMNAAAVADLRRRNKGVIWRAGAITAGLLTVPILNLAAPVIGTAAMVHVFQKLTRAP